MLSFISVTFSLEKSKIILIKGTLTSKNIQLFIGLVESAKVNAIVTNDYYQAIVYHQKAWPQEDSSVPVEMFFFFYMLLCMFRISLAYTECFKFSFLQLHQKPDVM